MEQGFTHFDDKGNAIMVDVSKKDITERVAVAKGFIKMNAAAFNAVCDGTVKKGGVLGVARVAGIMAVKKTSELIPMCHPLMIDKCAIDFRLMRDTLCAEAVCTVKLTGKTGVEMEALTGVSVALLTIYDMCKAIDRGMEIYGICLVEKSGGKSGRFVRQ